MNCGAPGLEGTIEKDRVGRAMAELSDRIREAERATRDWGVEPDQMEGKFVAAILGAIRAVGTIVAAGAGDAREIVADAKELAELELEKLRKYNMAAVIAIRQAEVAKEAVIANVTKGLTDRLISESQKWLILKQTSYNRRQAWRLAGVVSVCAVLIGAVGYELRAWEDEGAVGALERCAARPLTATMSGQRITVCAMNELAARTGGSEFGGSEGLAEVLLSLIGVWACALEEIRMDHYRESLAKMMS